MTITTKISKQGRILQADVNGSLADKDRLIELTLNAHNIPNGLSRDGWRLTETKLND